MKRILKKVVIDNFDDYPPKAREEIYWDIFNNAEEEGQSFYDIRRGILYHPDDDYENPTMI